VFYLLSPTVYAFFSEVRLSYSMVPKWFASTPPALLTASIFDRYNANAPRAARFKQHLSCYLTDHGATRHPGCLHEIHAGNVVYGPPMLKTASGHYIARFEFSGHNDVCSAGEARVEVATVGRFGRVLATYSGKIRPDERLELPFHLKLMDAALGALEFRVSGVSKCIMLTGVDWTER
jgi:hypothetical protein